MKNIMSTINIKDEMTANIDFDLQKSINYFVNQIQEKYLMKNREQLENDDQMINVRYYNLGRKFRPSNIIKNRKANSKKKASL